MKRDVVPVVSDTTNFSIDLKCLCQQTGTDISHLVTTKIAGIKSCNNVNEMEAKRADTGIGTAGNGLPYVNILQALVTSYCIDYTVQFSLQL